MSTSGQVEIPGATARRGPGLPGRLRPALGWLGQVLAWCIVLAATAAIVVAVLVPRLIGATPYTILTGSMSPAMPPGTLVVTKPVGHRSIGVGDVITYQLHSGKPAVVTHRVRQVRIDAGGHYSFITQGDANPVADAKPVRPVQVRGERAYYVPYLGYAELFLSGKQRSLLQTGAAIALLGYAGFMFVGAARDRRRRTAASAGEES